MLIEWKDNLNLGIPEMDRQHRAMATHLNHLFTMVRERPDSLQNEEEIEQELHTLYHNARAHFQCEERLMREYGYPDLGEHEREHAMLLAELKTLIGRLERGEEMLDTTTMEALRSWLVTHILFADRAFARSARPPAL